ncbi:TadE/TadG family type IV pilus assembly protein (plasmid) [Isosphaeraceae bacterium EP7]
MRHTVRGRRKKAAAALELTILLPWLCLLALGSLDIGRVLSAHATITDCARNGALHASDATAAARSPYANYAAAAMADGASLSPALTASNVSLSTSSDSYGSYVEVKVAHEVPLLCGVLSASTCKVSRTVRMRVAP